MNKAFSIFYIILIFLVVDILTGCQKSNNKLILIKQIGGLKYGESGVLYKIYVIDNNYKKKMLNDGYIKKSNVKIPKDLEKYIDKKKPLFYKISYFKSKIVAKEFYIQKKFFIEKIIFSN